MLRRGRFQQGAVDGDLEVPGDQFGQDIALVRLEDVGALDLDRLARDRLLGHRQQLDLLQPLRQRGDEVVVDHHHLVDLALLVEVGHPLGDRLRV